MKHAYDTDYDFTAAVSDAYHGVKTITGETSNLIFSDTELALEGAHATSGEKNANPLDVLGYKPYADANVAAIYIDMPRNEFFGGADSRTYHAGLKADANLYTIMVAIEEGLAVTNDYHHVFLEGWEATHLLHPFEGPVLILRPILGS